MRPKKRKFRNMSLVLIPFTTLFGMPDAYYPTNSSHSSVDLIRDQRGNRNRVFFKLSQTVFAQRTSHLTLLKRLVLHNSPFCVMIHSTERRTCDLPQKTN